MATDKDTSDALARQARHWDNNRRHEERKRRSAGIPPLGSPMKCERCGEFCPQTNGAQKYCSECSKVVTRERRRIANKKYVDANGRTAEAPEVRRERSLRYAKAHHAKVIETNRIYRDANREKINADARARNQTDGRRQWRRKWENDKRRSDPRFALNARMKASIRLSLKGSKAGRPWEGLVGYSVSDLKRHLERQFVKGMSWEVFGRDIHIDHIRPLSSFRFETSADPAFREAWALVNLRPMWAAENSSKGSKRLFLL